MREDNFSLWKKVKKTFTAIFRVSPRVLTSMLSWLVLLTVSLMFFPKFKVSTAILLVCLLPMLMLLTVLTIVERCSRVNSAKLQRCWCDRDGKPIGYVVVAEVTWETCAYTARYVMKKLKGTEAKFYSDFNIQPEFTLMSRKPGIARQYFDDHQEIYDFDFINISTNKGGKKFRPPRYYDKLFDVENPAKMQSIKEVRQKLASEAQKAKLQRSTLTVEELLNAEEAAKAAQIKSLRRNII